MCRSFTYVEASGRDLKRNDGTFRFLLLFDEVALIPSETADNKTSLLTDYSYSLVAFAELPLVQSRSIQKYIGGGNCDKFWHAVYSLLMVVLRSSTNDTYSRVAISHAINHPSTTNNCEIANEENTAASLSTIILCSASN